MFAGFESPLFIVDLSLPVSKTLPFQGLHGPHVYIYPELNSWYPISIYYISYFLNMSKVD